jgi:hypothetical protein
MCRCHIWDYDTVSVNQFTILLGVTSIIIGTCALPGLGQGDTGKLLHALLVIRNAKWNLEWNMERWPGSRLDTYARLAGLGRTRVRTGASTAVHSTVLTGTNEYEPYECKHTQLLSNMAAEL